MTTVRAYRDIDACHPLRQIGRMSEWKKVGENLVRHWAGTIYLRAKVAGKPVRISLQTEDLRIAKLKRDDQLAAIRTAAAEKKSKVVRTLEDALDLFASGLAKPHLKKATVEDYTKRVKYLRESLPLQTHGRAWSQPDAEEWWKAITKKLGARMSNKLLHDVRKVVAILIEHGIRTSDPTAGFKPIKPVDKPKNLPSPAQMEEIIHEIDIQGMPSSTQSARMVAFMAYSGCRPNEPRHISVTDIRGNLLAVTGDETGTKTRKYRMIPINKPLRKVIDAILADLPEGQKHLFTMKSPRMALTNACDRLKLPHMSLYDLRHYFTTWCIESGVDIPTLALWLGHQDGGALLMDTYTHLRDQHSQKQARKLK